MLKKPASLAFARHSRLTISAAFTNLPRLIRRDVNLRGSTYGLGKRLFTQAMGWAGEKSVTHRLLRHRALTDSRPSADVTLIILRVADLAAALPDGLFDHPADTGDLVRTFLYHHNRTVTDRFTSS